MIEEAKKKQDWSAVWVVLIIIAVIVGGVIGSYIKRPAPVPVEVNTRDAIVERLQNEAEAWADVIAKAQAQISALDTKVNKDLNRLKLLDPKKAVDVMKVYFPNKLPPEAPVVQGRK
jgi:hypothetical protein